MEIRHDTKTFNKSLPKATPLQEGTDNFRRFFLAREKEISPWHDLPLAAEAGNGRPKYLQNCWLCRFVKL